MNGNAWKMMGNDGKAMGNQWQTIFASILVDLWWNIAQNSDFWRFYVLKSKKTLQTNKKTNPAHGQKIEGFQDFTSYWHGVSNVGLNRFPLMSHFKCRFPLISHYFPLLFHLFFMISHSFFYSFLYISIYISIYCLYMNCLLPFRGNIYIPIYIFCLTCSPGRWSIGSGSKNSQIAASFASVALTTTPFMPESMFLRPIQE